MTLDEIKKCDKAFLLAQDVAPVLGSSAQTIRVAARVGALNFPYLFTGNRLKIPRIPFLKFMGVL